jgi:hypothetical protein
MNNLDIYEKVREVPENAQKKIAAGRIKGFTDINPMWRIKALTEQFGPCGTGWYYTIEEKWLDKQETGEIITNILINLYVKIGDDWSKPIQGIGGSMQVSKESKGMYISDESYKMALTDAISVACKALGVGADVYWQSDRTKYSKTINKAPNPNEIITTEQLRDLLQLAKMKNVDIEKAYQQPINTLTFEQFDKAMKKLSKM